ncbi:MAG TPA: adenylate kinase [Candidatus Limnocylindria bacterium]|jgi:adenylate kinase family enzyme
MRRVVVGGETSAGKTTFSRALAGRLGVPAIELDALFWGPGWSRPAPDVFHERVATAVAVDAWVVDGNYSAVRDLIWARADTFIWLDPPFRVLLWRLFRRTNRRIRTGEELWSGNRERFGNAYLSRDSLYVWLIRAHPRHRRDWPAAIARYPQLQVLRFRSAGEAADWLDAVRPSDEIATP